MTLRTNYTVKEINETSVVLEQEIIANLALDTFSSESTANAQIEIDRNKGLCTKIHGTTDQQITIINEKQTISSTIDITGKILNEISQPNS